jgi:hypothetical protein
MSYTPHGPVSKTLDLLANVLAGLAPARAFLGAANQAAALGRTLPGDGGFLAGLAGAWDGTSIACAPPAFILEAEAPEYELVSVSTWRVTHSISLHLIHPRTPTDSAVDAYLRAWDDHTDIQGGLRAATPTQIVLRGVLTSQAPVVFGSTAPPVLQKHYLSTITVRYEKGQP